MTALRFYSATAVRTQLTASISGSATVATVASTSGFPASVPFTLLLDPGQLTEEVVSVTSVGGLTLTLARGQDGTSAVPHDVGTDVRHGLSARDLREPQEHIAATNGVHGVTGQIVGTFDTQGLTNKSIDGSLNTLTNIPKAALPTDTVYTSAAQTLTNKTLSGASNTLTNIPLSSLVGAATSYAPGLSGVTLGAGTLVGESFQVGKLVVGWANVNLASDSSSSATTTYLGLPAAAAGMTVPHVGTALLLHGSTRTPFSVELDTVSRVLFVAPDGTLLGSGSTTMQASDTLRLQFNYRAA